jgi:predicted esterase
MTALTFDELTNQITKHFTDRTYANGLAIVEKYIPDFPEQAAHLQYLAMCLASRLGDKPGVCSRLGKMLQQGIWYSEQILRDSPSLLSMQGDNEYEQLTRQSIAMQTQAFETHQSLLVVHPQAMCLEGEYACPVLIALHSNGETPQQTLSGWGRAAQDGWLVSMPISPSCFWAGSGHFWVDHETSAQEIIAQTHELGKKYNLDLDSIVLAGFSMGGEIALWMALKEVIQARGFLLLGPGGPLFDNPEQWLPILDEAKGLDLRGYIIFSEDDLTIQPPKIRQVVELLNHYQIPTQLEVRKNLSHEYPPDFREVIAKATSYLLE